MELEYKEHLSPMLKGDIKNYLIDIDGTITDDVPNEEPERMVTCEPFPDALATINKWYDEGHQICFFTSRTEDLREITETWLNKHGFKYHSVLQTARALLIDMKKALGGSWKVWVIVLEMVKTR